MKEKYLTNARIIDPKNNIDEVGGLIIDYKGSIKAVGKNDSSPNGKRFVNKPRLSKDASKNIRAKFLSLKKDNDGNIIEYKFNIIYTSTGKTKKNKVDIRWVYKTEDIPSAIIKKINKLISGPRKINKGGESRRIVIQGDPGAEFAIAINESFIEEEIDIQTLLFVWTILKRIEKNL